MKLKATLAQVKEPWRWVEKFLKKNKKIISPKNNLIRGIL